MSYITQLTGRKAISISQIMTMILTGFVLVVLQSSTVQAQWATNGNNINNTNTGNVGIGTTSPSYKLQIVSGNGQSLFGDPTSSQFFYQIRPNSGKQGWVAFTEDGVADRWAMGIKNADAKLYFSTGNIGSLTDRVIIDGNGNVGIGTTTPVQRFQIGSNTVTSTATPDAVSLGGTYSSVAGANPKLRLFDNNAGIVYGLGVSANQFDFMTPPGTRYVWSVSGTEKMRLDDSGNLTVTGNIAAKYQDVAEWVQSSQELVAGTVVVLDQTKSNQVIASSQAYDTRVAGVISSQPGITLGEKGESKVLVATTGRVKVKVDASAGPIRVGDLLVTSDKEGVAKKSEPLNLGGVQIHRPGTLIGKALEPLAKGTGEILVLLSLQ